MSHKVIALIVAAGNGERVGGKQPKQYMDLAGRPLLRRTIKQFYNHSDINNVQVVIHPDHHVDYEKAIEGLELLPSIHGGKTRQESVRLGLEHIAARNPDFVLIHDAARPFVKASLITELVKELQHHQAVVPALKIVDTIKHVEGHYSTNTVDRKALWTVQTPQAFHFQTILDAHQQAKGAEEATDDASLLERQGQAVYIIEGEATNFKVTTQDDFDKATQYVAKETTFRVGSGTDVHAFCDPKHSEDNTIRLCGVEIPFHKSLEGHSDADVGLHAIVDALLGAVSAGDIGQHFPPTDDKWKGADSALFTEHARHLVEKIGGTIEHLDVTIIGQKPKIAPYREMMQEKVAKLLGVNINAVNIKATTTEKLGFLGRSEGLMVQAVATVKI